MKKKVAVFQTNLRVGGIQRSLVSLLSLMADREDIELFVFINDGRDAFFRMPQAPNIHVFYTSLLPFWVRFVPFRLARRLFGGRIRKQIAGAGVAAFDASIDFDSYQMATAIGALEADSCLRLCWVHNDVEKKYASEWKYRLLHFFFRSKYRCFDRMVMVSDGVREPFYRLNPQAAADFVTVNNSVDRQALRKGMEVSPGEDTDRSSSAETDRVEIVTMGRLFVQKGSDTLLSLIKEAARHRSSDEIHFTIIGDGPDRKHLEAQTGDIREYITFTGNLREPFGVMSRADAFLCTSRYEGQSLALLEALALGLPVIMPRELEPYCRGMIRGCDDLPEAVLGVVKRRERPSEPGLSDYNEMVAGQFMKALER